MPIVDVHEGDRANVQVQRKQNALQRCFKLAAKVARHQAEFENGFLIDHEGQDFAKTSPSEPCHRSAAFETETAD